MKGKILLFLLVFVFITGCKKEKAKEEAPKVTDEYSAQEIMIAFKGSAVADTALQRTVEDAQKLAQEIYNKVKDNPDKFEEYVQEYSEGPTKRDKGKLGIWGKETMMLPQIDSVVKTINIGEIAPPVKTEYGFHILKRLEVEPSEEVQMQLIIISYKNAERPLPNTKYETKDSAFRVAQNILKQVKENPEKFGELAVKYSEGMEARDSGKVRPFRTNRRMMMPELENAIVKLNIGEVSDIIETAFGFFILKRIEVVHPPKYAASHILISYKGAQRAGPDIIRTKEEAKKLAEEVARKAMDNPGQFGELAKQYSDDPSNKDRAGDLGTWEKGMMVSEFQNAVEKLKEGEVSGPVESPFGYHIILRKPVLESP